MRRFETTPAPRARRYAQQRKAATKLEPRRPGESLLEFKRRTKKVTKDGRRVIILGVESLV
jgi:hypothetical protein